MVHTLSPAIFNQLSVNVNQPKLMLPRLGGYTHTHTQLSGARRSRTVATGDKGKNRQEMNEMYMPKLSYYYDYQ